MWARRRLVAVLACVLLVFALAPPAHAEHTPNHRYFVTGTVRNEAGQPICGISVAAVDLNITGDPGRSVTTDWQGFYKIQLHLHSQGAVAEGEAAVSNEQDTVRVTVEGTGVSETHLAVPSGPGIEGWGIRTVDFVVSNDVASPGLCLVQLALYGGGAVVLLVLALVAWRFVRRPRGGGRAIGELRQVPGVGRSRARELASVGIGGVEDLAGANPEELSRKTTLTPKQARLAVKRANETVGKRT